MAARKPTGGKGSNQYVTRAGGSAAAKPRLKTAAIAQADDQSPSTQIAGLVSGRIRTKAQATKAADRITAVVEANPKDADAWHAALVWTSTDLLDSDPDIAIDTMSRLMTMRSANLDRPLPEELKRFVPHVLEREMLDRRRPEQPPDVASSSLKAYPSI